MYFKLHSTFSPTGDQPEAIGKLADGIIAGKKAQVLLGVTGSGKTYTLANVIKKVQKPTLVISHNKTLAAQLYQEFRDFFPKNAVSYFVSYYDYYQPEAYIPQTDTYIEKETDINEEIDKLRLLATTNLMTRPDTIIVASVSCIYNIGSPQEYQNRSLIIKKGDTFKRTSFLKDLVFLQYERSDYGLRRGTFSVKGETIGIWPAYLNYALRLNFLEDKVESIQEIDPLTKSAKDKPMHQFLLYPAKHYIVDPALKTRAFVQIRKDLRKRIKDFKDKGKLLEAQRLEQKVNYDLEMIEELGYVNGIENYSRYFDGRNPGEPPFTLLDYFPKDYLLIIDESHMTVPQIRGMYNGDASRKKTLVDFGFRLPAAFDNRPLRFDEFLRRTGQTVFVSATPAEWEKSYSQGRIVEQLIRPTGILDPQVDIRPTKGQIKDLVSEIIKRKKTSQRMLVTTLTKKMAEALSEYLNDPAKVKPGLKIKVSYLHSDIDTLERQDILDDLRAGRYDVLVGINLLREGLDLPEVSLVAILDADKEGFLRSETSLIQTMGRASRHVSGKVIMYADQVTGSMKRAIAEVERRRDIQERYNKTHHITPKTIKKPIRQKLIEKRQKKQSSNQAIEQLNNTDINQLTPDDRQKYIKSLEKAMRQAARELDFELAAKIRDKLLEIKD